MIRVKSGQNVWIIRVLAATKCGLAGVTGELVLKAGDLPEQSLTGGSEHFYLRAEFVIILLELLDVVRSLEKLASFAYFHRTV